MSLSFIKNILVILKYTISHKTSRCDELACFQNQIIFFCNLFVFINNSFKQIWRGLAVILGICVLYILWSELVTGPLNRTPEGRVTQGLPYPFLNDMTIKERIIFYATTMVTGLVFYFSGVFIYLIKTYFLGGDSNRRQRFWGFMCLYILWLHTVKLYGESAVLRWIQMEWERVQS